MHARQLLAEVRGGVTGAVLAIGILLPLAQLSFAALGHDALPHAIRAAFVSAVVGMVAAALVGGIALSNAIPRTSTCLIFAALVSSLAMTGLGVEDILSLATLCVLMSGVLQVIFGLIGMGSLVRYVPRPVIGGFVNGIAVLILIAQIAPLSGTVVRGASLGRVLGEVRPGTLVLGVGTALVMWVVARKRPQWPAALVALTAGTMVYLAVLRAWPGIDMGQLTGTPDSGLPIPVAWGSLLDRATLARNTAYLPQVAVSAAVMALIGSLDALLAAAATESALRIPYSPNRMLVGFGIANIASSAFGGLPALYSNSLVITAYEGGARSRWSVVLAAALLLMLLLFGSVVLGVIPLAVSAGVMVIIAIGLFDRWTPGLVRQLIARRNTAEVRSSLAIVAIVCLATIFLGFVVSIGVGVALSLLMFIAGINRSLIRSVDDASTTPSRRIYPADQASAVRAQGRRVKIAVLDGPIFFGTAETLKREIGVIARGATFVILDLDGVGTIDASGAMALERLHRQLADAGTRLLLAGISEGGRHARALHAYGHAMPDSDWFDDADQALEHTEWSALMQAGLVRSDLERPVAELPLMEGLTLAQRAALQASMRRRRFTPGEILFRRGDEGDELYALVRGSVTLVEGSGENRTAGRRIVSFRSGVVFGEVALLDGGARTATAICDVESIGYTLSRGDLERIRERDPDLAAQVLLNIARQISARLRFTTMVLWHNQTRSGGRLDSAPESTG